MSKCVNNLKALFEQFKIDPINPKFKNQKSNLSKIDPIFISNKEVCLLARPAPQKMLHMSYINRYNPILANGSYQVELRHESG